MKNIAIIDYKMGNLFSVQHACKKVGLNPVVTSSPDVINNSDGVILPGVGAFGEAMYTLNELDVIDPIKKAIAQGKPFMGICLGYQLLFSESEEFGNYKGLGIFNGVVKKFNFNYNNESKVKIPQIGWNQIYKYNDNWENSPLNGINESEFMYFVHSFYVKPKDDKIKLTKTFYEGFEYCSSIYYENIFASQYHPEKSAKEGIKIYTNWAESIK